MALFFAIAAKEVWESMLPGGALSSARTTARSNGHSNAESDAPLDPTPARGRNREPALNL